MKKETRTIILLFLFIIILSFLTYQNFTKFQKSAQEVSLPEFKTPEPEEFLPEKEGEKEFLTPDGKIKIKYPASWVEMGNEFIQTLNQGREEMAEEKIIFAASKATLKNVIPSYLFITEASLNNPENVFEKIKETNQAEIKILEIAKTEKEILFEATYTKEESSLYLRSKEKIISFPKKSYLISVFTTAENWEKITDDISFIFDSIEAADQ